MRENQNQAIDFKDVGTFAFYWRMAVRPYPRYAVAIVCLMLGVALLEALTIGMIVPLMDAVTATEAGAPGSLLHAVASWLEAVGITPTMNVITFFLLVVAGLLIVARSALFVMSQICTAAIAIKLRRQVMIALFDKFLNARYEDVSRRARGKIVYDINGPATAIAGAISSLGLLLTSLFTSILMIALLMYLSWWATLVIAVLSVIGVQGWRSFVDRRAAAYGRTLYGLRGDQNKLQVDAIDGLKVVKAHGLEPQMVDRLDAMAAAEYHPDLRVALFKFGPLLMNEVIAVVLVLGLGVTTFLVPELGLRFAMLAAFLLAIRRIAPSMATINSTSVDLNRHRRNLEVIAEVFERLPQERRGGKVIARIEEIRLDRVSFAYAARAEHQVLHDVSVSMRRGSVTALVGPTGSGKSTIAGLVLGLYEPQSGSVCVNGTDLQQVDLSAWRTHVGYVSQDIFVFNTTIRDNIALGDARVPLSQIEWAAKLAQLHGFVSTLKDGYDTVVGDRGLRLSGGQCQRLAIARAILKRPSLMIFDEATSALDNLTERAVYEAIRTLHHDAIVFVIAHRLTTVREADQIVVLDAGRVVEQGTHDSLMRRQGKYAGLYAQDDHAGTFKTIPEPDRGGARQGAAPAVESVPGHANVGR